MPPLVPNLPHYQEILSIGQSTHALAYDFSAVPLDLQECIVPLYRKKPSPLSVHATTCLSLDPLDPYGQV